MSYWSHIVSLADYDNDGRLDLFNGKLYRNVGGEAMFEEVTAFTSSINPDAEGCNLADTATYDWYGAAWAVRAPLMHAGAFDVESHMNACHLCRQDIDGDGDLDLAAVSCQNILIMRNDPGGTFVKVSTTSLGSPNWRGPPYEAKAGLPLAWFDYDSAHIGSNADLLAPLC